MEWHRGFSQNCGSLNYVSKKLIINYLTIRSKFSKKYSKKKYLKKILILFNNNKFTV